MVRQEHDQTALVLAAEDFDSDRFAQNHYFSPNDKRIITKLVAHGPVLIQGGRGSGKSALLIAASHELGPDVPDSSAIGVYLSLRHSPLLKSEGSEYRAILLGLLAERIADVVAPLNLKFKAEATVVSVQRELSRICAKLQKRIVIMFDDAAHIGREASLSDFFDLFRTLSSDTISCKATIYPGVTSFGDRFDLYNDATVIDVVRDEGQSGFEDQFAHVLRTRFPSLVKISQSEHLDDSTVAAFLGKAVVGNMRGFIFACGQLEQKAENRQIGMSLLGETLIEISNNYYWPLFEEVSPKLGKYVPLVKPSQAIATYLFKSAAKRATRSVIVHKDHLGRMAKAFEILEYVGFIAKKESSRGMKSGGRGSRYMLNLCVLLEQIRGSRLTLNVFKMWQENDQEPMEIHSSNPELSGLKWPALGSDGELPIFRKSIKVLKKSAPYPYGLTPLMVTTLYDAGIKTVGQLDSKSDEYLDALPSIGYAKIRRIRNVIGQAVWM